MFSGLFNQEVAKAPPLGSKSGGGQDKVSKKPLGHQKKDPTVKQNDQITTKSKKRKNKRDGNGSKVPAGGIPMTESEIADFQKWLATQKSGSTKQGKNEKTDPTDTGAASTSDSSRKNRKRSRKRKNEDKEETDTMPDRDGENTPTDQRAASLANSSRKSRKRSRKKNKEGKQDVDERNAKSNAPSSQPQKKKLEEVSKRGDAPLSKKAKKKLRKQQFLEKQSLATKRDKEVAPVSVAASLATAKGSAVSKAAARLQGSRFRWLNDKLYSISGEEAFELYSKDPSLATAYHEGFREQVRKWPRNPLDDVIQWLKNDVPREKVVGDFGCGEAVLALELQGRTVHSFDLIKINERITPCNLASVPLGDQTIDVAVFCLALMGTDWLLFLTEAHRCLRQGGILQIMEVESRMSDINAMSRQVEALGFSKLFVKPGNFFIEMRFKKSGSGKAKLPNSKNRNDGSVLAGCTYRKR